MGACSTGGVAVTAADGATAAVDAVARLGDVTTAATLPPDEPAGGADCTYTAPGPASLAANALAAAAKSTVPASAGAWTALSLPFAAGLAATWPALRPRLPPPSESCAITADGAAAGGACGAAALPLLSRATDRPRPRSALPPRVP